MLLPTGKCYSEPEVEEIMEKWTIWSELKLILTINSELSTKNQKKTENEENEQQSNRCLGMESSGAAAKCRQ